MDFVFGLMTGVIIALSLGVALFVAWANELLGGENSASSDN